MVERYVVNWRQGMSSGSPLQFDASSPKSAAVKAGRWLGFIVEKTSQGVKYSYISESGEFDGSVPLSLAVTKLKSDGSKIRYYNVER